MILLKIDYLGYFQDPFEISKVTVLSKLVKIQRQGLLINVCVRLNVKSLLSSSAPLLFVRLIIV